MSARGARLCKGWHYTAAHAFTSPPTRPLASSDRPLTAGRNGLLGMGLLQGLLALGVIHSGLDRDWQMMAMPLIVQPPLFMAMAVTRWRDARQTVPGGRS